LVEKIITAIVNWVAEHLSPRYLIVTALITGLLLFLSPRFLAYFGLVSIAEKYRGWIALAFFFTTFLAISYPIEVEYLSWTGKRRVRKYINELSGSESNLLRRCLLNDGASISVIHDLGTARSLEKKGILWQSAERLELPAFNITDPAYRILKSTTFVQMSVPEQKEEP
jgi:Super-infection exclusion protein B